MLIRKFLPSAAVEGGEGLGHDVRGAGAAVSVGGGAVAAPALGVRHGHGLQGKAGESDFGNGSALSVPSITSVHQKKPCPNHGFSLYAPGL